MTTTDPEVNTMMGHATRRKSLFYLIGLCLACTVGYLVGNITGDKFNPYSVVRSPHSASSGIRAVSGDMAQSLHARLPFGVCDDDDCTAISAEDIEVVSHSPPTRELDEDSQASRRRTIQRTCREYKNLTTSRLSDDILKQLIVDEKHKVLYCSIPKAGCTNWKRLLMAAMNESIDMSSISKDYAHHNDILRTLYDYPEERRHSILSSFKKFTVVRNPFIRLLSAYKDKFESLWQYREDPNGVYFRHYAAEIMTKYRGNATSEELKSGENVTWTEFIMYVTHLAEDRFNAHWVPMYRLCAPCLIDYDFIGRIETMDVDAKQLLRTLLTIDNAPKKFPHYFDLTTNSSKYTYTAYGDITLQQLRRLWDIYKWDFWLFGYKKPDFI